MGAGTGGGGGGGWGRARRAIRAGGSHHPPHTRRPPSSRFLERHYRGASIDMHGFGVGEGALRVSVEIDDSDGALGRVDVDDGIVAVGTRWAGFWGRGPVAASHHRRIRRATSIRRATKMNEIHRRPEPWGVYPLAELRCMRAWVGRAGVQAQRGAPVPIDPGAFPSPKVRDISAETRCFASSAAVLARAQV